MAHGRNTVKSDLDFCLVWCYHWHNSGPGLKSAPEGTVVGHGAAYAVCHIAAYESSDSGPPSRSGQRDASTHPCFFKILNKQSLSAFGPSSILKLPI